MKTVNKSIIIGGFICFALLFFQAQNPLIANAIVECSGNNCWFTTCNSNFDCGTNQFIGEQLCKGNSVYQSYMTFTCNSPGTADSNCTRSVTTRHQITCEVNQICRYGMCVDGGKTGGTSNINQLRCVGNSVYWYDSLGNQLGLYQTCASNQICSNGSCVISTQPVCTSHVIKGCLNNSVYWYNSCGNIESLYQNCNLTNQVCQNGLCLGPIQPAYTPLAPTTPIITTTTVVKENLTISIFGQKKSELLQWSKNISVSDKDKINFLITVKNYSNESVDDVLVKVDIGNNIAYANDLKIDNVSSDKNIISGINLGKLPSDISKVITFAGLVDAKDYQGVATVKGNVSAKDMSDSDFLTINIEKPGIATAALGESPAIEFIKKWYIFAIIAVVLIILFIIIFRRLSSNV